MKSYSNLFRHTEGRQNSLSLFECVLIAGAVLAFLFLGHVDGPDMQLEAQICVYSAAHNKQLG